MSTLPPPPSGPPLGAPAGPPSGYPVLDVSRTPPIPFTRLVKVELRKAFDTRASFFLFIAVSVIVIMIEGFLLLVGILNSTADFQFAIYTAPVGFVLQPALAVVTVLLVTTEWTQRTAMVTFSLEPRRLHVILAKYVGAVVLAAIIVGFVIVVAFLCSGVNWLFASGFEWKFSVGQILGLVVFEALAVTVAFALATLLLNTPAAIGAFPVIVYVVPFGVALVDALWSGFKPVGRAINFLTAQAPLSDWSLNTGSEWGHLVVSVVIWAVVPLVLGFARILRAEVK